MFLPRPVSGHRYHITPHRAGRRSAASPRLRHCSPDSWLGSTLLQKLTLKPIREKMFANPRAQLRSRLHRLCQVHTLPRVSLSPSASGPSPHHVCCPRPESQPVCESQPARAHPSFNSGDCHSVQCAGGTLALVLTLFLIKPLPLYLPKKVFTTKLHFRLNSHKLLPRHRLLFFIPEADTECHKQH